MKILIFGGAGFIGTNIVLEAKKKGHTPVVFDSFVRRGVEENIIPSVQYIRGDIRNPEDLRELPRVDRIINLAANPGVPWSISYPLYDFNVNALGALNILEYARNNGNIPVVFASTNKVYHDGINEIPMTEYETRYAWDGYTGIKEDFPIDSQGKHPKSPYGVSKTAADLYHQEYRHMYKLPTVVNRMSCIYGHYQQGVEDQGWVNHFVRQLTTGDNIINIYGNGKQVRDMLFGTDVAELYIDQCENIEKYQGGVYNVGGGHFNTISLIESINYIEKLTGNKAILKYYPERPADQRIYISNIHKVCSVNGWKPKTKPEKGIKLMYESIPDNIIF